MAGTFSRTSSHRPLANNRMWLLSLALSGLFIGLFLGWVTIRLIAVNNLFGQPDFKGIVMPSPEPVNDFALTAHTGEEVRLQDFRGQVVLLYYGYTYCPDVCPATLASLAKAKRMLDPEQGKQVQVLMITVDPERDTPEALAEYMAHFDPSFLGLTGAADQIADAAESLGIYYQKRDGSVETGYLVDHTATVAAIDQRGYLRLVYPFDTPGEDIGADLRLLLRD